MEKINKKIIISVVSIIVIVVVSTITIKNKNILENIGKMLRRAEETESFSYNNPYMPNGFYYIEGEWDTGFVIEDAANGNQFVWIPVDGTNVKLERKNYSVTDVQMEECTEHLDSIFEESVLKYGGYYVARYESGIPNNITFESEDDMDISGKPVSIRGRQIWNNISYSYAKASAEQMYGTNAEVTSSIMNSYAYDTMLTWLETKGYNLEDSSSWGNYSNNSQTNEQVEAAGSVNTWKANNIYDLAGNVSEWTSEKNGSQYIYRGGSYLNAGNITPAEIREAGSEGKTSNAIGFRAILYKTGNSTIEGYNEPYVPIGFTHIEGEWNTGFVIREDVTGNEFVWIPVDGYNLKLDRSEFEKTFITMAKCQDTLEFGYKLSVYAYGGYYVSRYEAGIGATSGNNEGVPVSKKGATVWTNISQMNAQKSAEKMYENNTQINSRLMNSYAYDTMLNWLKKADYSTNTYNVDTDSSSWGNYKSNIKGLSGSSESWKANNIYDIAGNVWEWTTEHYRDQPIARGGDYFTSGDILTAGTRDNSAIDSTFDYLGFRILMYKDISELGGPKEPTIEVAIGTQGENGWYTSDVDVKVIAGYTGLGVQKVTYEVTGTAKSAGNIGEHSYNKNSSVNIRETEITSGETFKITTDGEFTITAYTYDLAGNKSEAGTLVVKKDATLPINIQVSSTDLVNNQYTISVTATDDTSGVAVYEYYINDELKATTNQNTYTFTNNVSVKTYRAYVKVKDTAGNIATSDICIIKAIRAKDIANNASRYFGGTITNYVAPTMNGINYNQATSSWKIYYADDINIYIIADDVIQRTYAPKTTSGLTVTSSSTTSQTKASFKDVISGYSSAASITYKKWLSYLDSYGTSSNTQANIRACAYLLDQNIWKCYKNDKAEYVMGCPTFDLFIASWNKTQSSQKEFRAQQLGYQFRSIGSNTWANATDGTLTSAGRMPVTSSNPYYDLYRGKSDTYYFASPSNRQNTGTTNEKYLITYKLQVNGTACESSIGGAALRPVVCLKQGVCLEEQSDGTYIIL